MAGYLILWALRTTPAQMMDTGLMGAFSGSSPEPEGWGHGSWELHLQADRPPSIAGTPASYTSGRLDAPKEYTTPCCLNLRFFAAPADLLQTYAD
ncbi:microtubule-associated protein 4-like isoform X1 [Lates japonicus]|uniref:Microtubule-associated protein 4-like isoform X1 n=1 Tax=Lates japonicus TaxID=270547 RepID=A0AAD3MK22_LATJO|nr:microtubule-associated protein 4-like isoform X1 [Lates japonicus]